MISDSLLAIATEEADFVGDYKGGEVREAVVSVDLPDAVVLWHCKSRL